MTADLEQQTLSKAELRRATRVAVGAAIRSAYTGLYTQTELSKRVGVAQNTLSRWTTGEVEPSLSDLVAIENACELPRGHILRAAGLVEEIGSPEQAIATDHRLDRSRRQLLLAAYHAALGQSRS